MNQELKDLLKPPFVIDCHGKLINGDNNPLADIISWSDEGNEFNEIELFIWIAIALNEKWERDFGEPLRWIAVPEEERNEADYEYDCPKCNSRQYFYEGEMVGYDYCPSCGKRLDPPEEAQDAQ